MAPSIRTRPSFPLVSLSHQEASISLLPSEGEQNVNHSHRKLTKLITWTTALSNSMKLWAMPCRSPRTDGSWWRVLTKRGLLENGMANHFSILALRTPWTEWKAKRWDTERWTPQVSRCPIATGDRWRNNCRKNEETEPKQTQQPVVDVTGDGSKVWCCKEQYC